jgi:DNA-binding transcriptional regulator/RsmH inhibitor MraZ
VYRDEERRLKVNIDDKRRMTFPLRLAVSLKDMANVLAQQDGVSLNHFISLAVAEKISRLETETLSEQHDLSKRHKMAMAAGVINKTLYS